MGKSRLLIEKVRARPEYRILPKAKDDVDFWRFGNDTDWKEMMICLEQAFYYRVLGGASLPKCIPNIFKTYGSISQSIWIELMVSSGCFSRAQATKVSDRGQGEACCKACRIPLLEVVPPNTTVGEIAARIRRQKGKELTIHSIMPREDESSGEGTPSTYSPLQVAKKSEQPKPLVLLNKPRPIPTFVHQYQPQRGDLPEVDVESVAEPEIQYVGAASKQIGGGPERKRLRDFEPYHYKVQRDDQKVKGQVSQKATRSSAGASSSTTLPDCFDLSPPVKTPNRPGLARRTDIRKRIEAAEKARQMIVGEHIPQEVRDNPDAMEKLKRQRIRQLNSVRMGSLGIDESMWSEPLDDEDDEVLLDLKHVLQPKPDPEAVKKIDAEIEEIRKQSEKTAAVVPSAPVKPKGKKVQESPPPVLENFDTDLEIAQLHAAMDAGLNQDSQLLPGLSSAAFPPESQLSVDQSLKRPNDLDQDSQLLASLGPAVSVADSELSSGSSLKKQKNDAIEVEDSEQDELKDQLKA